MVKIVINRCYGGFGISQAGMDFLKEKYNVEETSGYIIESTWDRHDPRMVDMVETLGNSVNHGFSKLEVVEIEGNTYRIEEYDGMESVETPNSIEWILVDGE